MRMKAAVLAGGHSMRMGTDKSELILGGHTVLDRVTSELEKVTPDVVMNKNHRHRECSLPIYEDIFHDVGPLGGIHAVLSQIDADWVIFSACDTPFINEDVYRYLLRYCDENHEAVVPVYEGRFHPLSGIYRTKIVHKIEQVIEVGERRVRSLFDRIKVAEVSDFEGIEEDKLSRHFFNMNTKADFKKAQQLLKSQESPRHL
ncbi:molybdenum cofactor guanylyltransferase [Halobacillus fulvus]|nr:molybdenum cofactor guanylyltransferase [Halobacillus fulvus]